MSDDGKDSGDTTDGAPIDFDRLDVIRERLAADSRFDRVDDQRIFASERLAGIEGGKPPSSRSERRVATWASRAGIHRPHTQPTPRHLDSCTKNRQLRVDYSARFRLLPTTEQRELLDWQRNTVRQVYNHALYRLNQLPQHEDQTVRQRVWQVRDELPEWKRKWPEWSKVYSTVLQAGVERIYHSITGLAQLRDNGHDIGELNWKKPREFLSFTYRQRGFELDEKGGPDGRGRLILKKVRGETIEIPIRLHRDLPDDAEIKHVSVKQEATGAWYASFDVQREAAEKPGVEDISSENTVGIDLGVLNFIHDSDGRSIDRLDLSDDRERLSREQRSLSRKQYESNNWERQRRRVAQVHMDMRNRKRDFKHKLAHFYTTEYDAVFVEDLDVRGMLESGENARNKAEVGWRDFIRVLKHHGQKHGCHVVEVDPAGTTKECSRCGVETEKPLWVREHSCPSCGLELDRDWNAALNVLSRGLERLGVVQSEATTPVETATAADTLHVSASRVVEAGSPCLKEPPQAASRQG